MKWPALGLGALLLACGPTEPELLVKSGTVRGSVDTIEDLGGAAWLFLYQPFEGPPGGPAFPKYLTSIGATRLGQGDAHFVFPNVEPNPWKLYGLLDTDGNFDPQIDVLTQPSAGDRVGEPLAINVQPGRGATVDYSARTLVLKEPPAFHVRDAVNDVSLDFDVSTGLTPITLVADSLGRFEASKRAFSIGLVDLNGDGLVDLDATLAPTLSLSFVLRWLPRPGQAPAGTNVIVPMLYNPAPFLSTLAGRLGETVAVETLQLVPVPQAQSVIIDDKGKAQRQTYGAPPRGDYELIAVQTGGQFWRLPNQLGDSVPSQAVRLHSDRN